MDCRKGVNMDNYERFFKTHTIKCSEEFQNKVTRYIYNLRSTEPLGNSMEMSYGDEQIAFNIGRRAYYELVSANPDYEDCEMETIFFTGGLLNEKDFAFLVFFEYNGLFYKTGTFQKVVEDDDRNIKDFRLLTIYQKIGDTIATPNKFVGEEKLEYSAKEFRERERVGEDLFTALQKASYHFCEVYSAKDMIEITLEQNDRMAEYWIQMAKEVERRVNYYDRLPNLDLEVHEITKGAKKAPVKKNLS